LSYVLTTAENELGVVVATSATSGNSQVFYHQFLLLISFVLHCTAKRNIEFDIL